MMIRRAVVAVASLLLRAGGVRCAAAATSSPSSPDPIAAVAPSSREEAEAALLPLLPRSLAANWDIDFASFDADLSYDSTDEITLRYVVGRDRTFVARFLAADCASNVTGLEYNASDPIQIPFGYGDDHDLLTLGYSLDKFALGGSELWNATRSTIEFCHELDLVLPANETAGHGYFVIAQDVRRMRVNVDLSVAFAITAGLGPGGVIQMRILGEMNVTGLNDVDDDEDEGRAAGAVRRAFYRHVPDGLADGQDVVSAGATFVSRSNDDGGGRRLQDEGEGDEAEEEEVVANFLWELVLQEGCAIECQAFLNATTMYETVTSHLGQTFSDGTFALSVREFHYADVDDPPPADGVVRVDHAFRAKPPSGADYDDEEGSEFVWIPNLAYADATLEDYVEACRCDGADNFKCEGEEGNPLRPDAELRVCVWSNSDDILLDSLDRTSITQGSVTMEVIEEGGTIAVPTITSREYVQGRNGVVVTTRVPSNIFQFEEGESITISGVFRLGLRGSGGATAGRGLEAGGRGLQADADDRVDNGLSKVRAGANVARFKLDATLGEEVSAPILVSGSTNYRVAAVSRVVAAIGAVLLLW